MGFLEHVGVEVAEDAPRATVSTDEASENVSGGVHGGLIATLIDSAMGRAVREEVGDEKTAVTVQLSITYLNGAKPGDVLVATAKVGKQSKTLALVEADVLREVDDEVIAHGLATFAVTSKD